MEISAWVTLSLVFLWMIWMVFINWNRKGLPPYALKIPFLGNIHLLLMNGKSHHLIFGKIKEKLGPIYTMWFGKVPIIIVSDFEIAKKMLVSSTFAGRPQRISGEIISRGFKGMRKYPMLSFEKVQFNWYCSIFFSVSFSSYAVASVLKVALVNRDILIAPCQKSVSVLHNSSLENFSKFTGKTQSENDSVIGFPGKKFCICRTGVFQNTSVYLFQKSCRFCIKLKVVFKVFFKKGIDTDLQLH